MTREAPPYPPAAGPLAVYSKKQFHEYLDFAIENVSFDIFKKKVCDLSKTFLFLFLKYIKLETSSMGSYFHLKNSKGSWITYCQTDYIHSQFEPKNNEFNFDSNIKQGIILYIIFLIYF